MASGAVKEPNAAKALGLIQPDMGGPDVFAPIGTARLGRKQR